MATPLESVRDQVSAEERRARQHLAALYRLVAMHGPGDLVFAPITARVPGPQHRCPINPCGMLFAKVTAGKGGDLAWSAMLDKVEQHDPSFRQ